MNYFKIINSKERKLPKFSATKKFVCKLQNMHKTQYMLRA